MGPLSFFNVYSARAHNMMLFDRCVYRAHGTQYLSMRDIKLLKMFKY